MKIKVGKFNTGQMLFTRGIFDKMAENSDFCLFVENSLKRHIDCDWGELENEDRELNNQALNNGLRLLSAYICNHDKIWIINEADRSATTVLFPEEY
jgi:hypothetical protein